MSASDLAKKHERLRASAQRLRLALRAYARAPEVNVKSSCATPGCTGQALPRLACCFWCWGKPERP